MNTKTTNMEKRRQIIKTLKKSMSYMKMGKIVHSLYPDLFPKETYSRQRIHSLATGYNSPAHEEWKKHRVYKIKGRNKLIKKTK